MKEIRGEQIRSVFLEALSLQGAGRARLLDERCGGDRELRGEIESLLAHDPAGSLFLEQPAVQLPAALEELVKSEPPRLEHSGDQVGTYRLVRVVGEGTFGTVWQAERQTPFTQIVAVKIIKPGMDSQAVIARFEQERRALAAMNHPNIARIIDGGVTPQGRPFFAMEFVEGEPITEYAQRQGLDPEARLRLFRPVCEAVQHAHSKGIIHRDLKPANILVDALGAPRLLDFGIARAFGEDSPAASLTGRYGIIGTLSYMSPEQAAGANGDPDVRADVYSLGVVLYELLARRLPLDLSGKSVADAVRMVQDLEPPRIGSINQRFRGDIETIVCKAMEKQREQRYQSVAELESDLGRLLNNQPIQARPPSLSYVTRKLVRRNPVTTGLVIMALLALSAGLSAMKFRQAAIASRTARDAETQRVQQLAMLNCARELSTQSLALAPSNPELSRLLALQAYRFNEQLGADVLATGDATADVTKAMRLHVAHEKWDPLPAPDGLTVLRVALSPDGQQLAGAGIKGDYRRPRPDDGGVVLWNLKPANAALRPAGDNPKGGPGKREDAVGAANVKTLETPRLVTWVGFSPDERWIVGASPRLRDDPNGRLFLWDRDGFLQRTILDVPNLPGCNLAFAPIGSRLAGCSPSGRVWIGDLPDGFGGNGPLLLEPKLFEQGDFEDDTLVSLSWSPDGRWLAAACAQPSLLIWDMTQPTRNAKRLKLTGTEDVALWNSAFTANSRELWSAEPSTGTLIVWDLASLPEAIPEARRIRNAASSFGNVFVFTGPGNLRAVSNLFSNRVSVWNAAQPDAQPRVLEGFKKMVLGIQFSPDGGQLISCGVDGIRQWDLGGPTIQGDEFQIRPEDVMPIDTPKPGSGPRVEGAPRDVASALAQVGMLGGVQCLAFDPRGAFLAAGAFSADKPTEELFLWPFNRPDRAPTSRTWPSEPKPVSGASMPPFAFGGINAIAYSESGALLAVASGKSVRVLRDPMSDQGDAIVLEAGPGRPQCLDFGSSEAQGKRMLVSGDDMGNVTLWDVTGASPKIERVVNAHQGAVRSVAICRDGNTVASAGDDAAVRVAPLHQIDEPLLLLSGHSARVNSVQFSPDGRLLASASDDGTVRLWRRDAGWGASRVIRTPDSARAVVFDSTGDYLFVGIGPVLRAPETFVSGNVDSVKRPGAVLMVDLRPGRESCSPTELPGALGGVGCLALSADGSRIAAGTDDLKIKMWHTTPPVLAGLLSKNVNRVLTEQEWHSYVRQELPYAMRSEENDATPHQK